MYCKYCGTEIDEGDSYCTNCGKYAGVKVPADKISGKMKNIPRKQIYRITSIVIVLIIALIFILNRNPLKGTWVVNGDGIVAETTFGSGGKGKINVTEEDSGGKMDVSFTYKVEDNILTINYVEATATYEGETEDISDRMQITKSFTYEIHGDTLTLTDINGGSTSTYTKK